MDRKGRLKHDFCGFKASACNCGDGSDGDGGGVGVIVSSGSRI